MLESATSSLTSEVYLEKRDVGITVRRANVGDCVLRLVEKNGRYFGAIILDGKSITPIEGDNPDDVWRRLHDEVGRSNPKYFGFEGAQNRFLRFFPKGFQSDNYASNERNYKVAAKAKLDKTVPLDKALHGSGLGEAVLAVFRATNLLSPFEKTRLQDLLRGENADGFIRGAAKFTVGDKNGGLLEMAQNLRPSESAKWTVVTYLPFLWRPSEHMFLKPEVTKDFAERVGHRFANDYTPRLEISVYDSLCDLVMKTELEIEILKPRDRIDVQSFIWVVGSYKDETEAEGREPSSA